MERFKACEKEMKTKAFSKEGLIAAAKLDPAEKAKVEMCNWITSQVDELSRQIESSEAEIEQLQAGAGKKKKGSAASGATAERAANLENFNERRSWHVSRLEILHRMIENGQLEPERVEEIKEDVVYFVESNGEEDFEEDDGIYDEFDLDEQEEAYGLKADDEAQSSHDGVSVADEQSATPPPPPSLPTAKAASSKDSKRRDSEHDATAASQAAVASSSGKADRKGSASNAPSRKASDTLTKPPPADTKAPPVPPVNFAAAKQSPATVPASVTSPQKPTSAASALPPIRYAAAAAAAVGSSTTNAASTSASTVPTVSPVALENTTTESVTTSAPTASTAADSSASPAVSHAPSQQTSLSGEGETSANGPPVPPGLARAQSPAVNGSAKASPSLTHASVSEQAGGAGSRLDGSRAHSPSVASSSAHQASYQGQHGAPGSSKGASSEARLPSSLADLASSFESAKMKSLNREENISSIHKSLDSSFVNVPEPLDSEKPKYYVPQNHYPTPSYYPQNPSAIFDSPAVYSKFDEDTLFYIFYYQQGTYHQYLAAGELKRQSWRFHKQFLTWFRRHSEPQLITDEFEQGVYVYFDWEGSWAQRKKSDFRFEYRWLED